MSSASSCVTCSARLDICVFPSDVRADNPVTCGAEYGVASRCAVLRALQPFPPRRIRPRRRRCRCLLRPVASAVSLLFSSRHGTRRDVRSSTFTRASDRFIRRMVLRVATVLGGLGRRVSRWPKSACVGFPFCISFLFSAW